MNNLNCPHCGAANISNAKYCSKCGEALPRIEIETKSEATLPPPVKKRKNNPIVIIVTVLTFFLGYYGVQQLFFKKPAFDKAMMEAASELNKSCPIMVDQYTRLDNAVALPENAFQYNYTLVNIDKAQVNLDTVKKYIEPSIINNVKTNPDLKIYRDNKITMVYNYNDKNGIFVFKLAVTPEMYKED